MAALEARSKRLRSGALLALLALFGQFLVSVLPMPAMAGTAPICQLDDGTASAPATPVKAPAHASLDCPVCQAAQLLGSLVPPSAPPILLPPATVADRVVAAAIRAPLRRATTPYYSRGPPTV